jgi:LacI family transcriptional regulator
MAGPDEHRRITLKDVAAKAGVSLASASYAINETGSLGAAMRSHILRVAAELGYRHNFAAKAMRTGKTSTIGLVIPDLTNPFFPSLAQAVIQRGRHHDYTVIVTVTESVEDVERSAIQLLVERGVDGIVWFPIQDKNSAKGIIERVPTIVLDRNIAGFESIQADNAGGGIQAAEHLIELGHRHIGIISGPFAVRSMVDRCHAAAQYITQHATLDFHVENSFASDLEPDVVETVRAMKATAIFAGGDVYAMGVIKLLRQLGKRVPEDVSVVGFDDTPWCDVVSPRLTTVEMPIEDMAAEAVDALIRRIDSSANPRRRIILETRLIVRDSTAPRVN